MGWFVKDGRIGYQIREKEVYPSATEIYSLNAGEKICGFPESTSPRESLPGIRFSRLAGKHMISVRFDETDRKIVLEMYVIRGKLKEPLPFTGKNIPDSIVVNGSWYNLLTSYDDILLVLEKAGIQSNGEIRLNQYIILKREVEKSDTVEFEDTAEASLSEHPVSKYIIAGTETVKLNATLYPYQKQGYKWMKFISDENCGCILGDEMGLGKTLQVIALIADRINRVNGVSLVVAPVSLLENWRREFEKFAPGIRVLMHHGARRTGIYKELKNYNVILISYNTAVSDQSLLRMICWDLVVVDEAQNIKNPSAVRTKSVKNIPRSGAIAVTGTPFENHISDLWSLLDFIAPGCFGKLSEFEAVYPDDLDGAKALEPILSPVMIRRRVADVARDLPERVDVPQVLQMLPEEVVAYEEIRKRILDSFNGKNVTFLMIQKLRMYCTHPMLLDEEMSGDPVRMSRKYERLCELMEEIVSLGEKAILFTSYNRMFKILQEDISKRFAIRTMAINGSTPMNERQEIIDSFSNITGSALLVLNPRAAGTGLNITAASRVIHYNLEWNPSLEDQASARAYRRGQRKTVFVYRLYYRDTVEQIINERIEKKRDMSEAAVVGTDGSKENSEDIIRALMITPGGSYERK